MSTQAVSWDDRPPLDQELRGIVRVLVDRARRELAAAQLAAAHLCRNVGCEEPIESDHPAARFCSRTCAKADAEWTRILRVQAKTSRLVL